TEAGINLQNSFKIAVAGFERDVPIRLWCINVPQTVAGSRIAEWSGIISGRCVSVIHRVFHTRLHRNGIEALIIGRRKSSHGDFKTPHASEGPARLEEV